ADDVLRQGVQGISDLVTQPGVINLDFADVKAIMENAGEALMGIGHGAGDSRAEDAAKQAVSSPLLETSIDGAKGILFNITAGKDITLQEVQRAAEIVRAAADPGANIIFGVVRDDTMAGEIKITVIATGFGGKTQKDGRREDFDPQKLFTGLKKATEKRDISPERLRAIVDDIEAELRRSGRVEIPSGEIGEMVMDRLRDLDEVAYIRFASVYREFM